MSLSAVRKDVAGKGKWGLARGVDHTIRVVDSLLAEVRPEESEEEIGCPS